MPEEMEGLVVVVGTAMGIGRMGWGLLIVRELLLLEEATERFVVVGFNRRPMAGARTVEDAAAAAWAIDGVTVRPLLLLWVLMVSGTGGWCWYCLEAWMLSSSLGARDTFKGEYGALDRCWGRAYGDVPACCIENDGALVVLSAWV